MSENIQQLQPVGQATQPFEVDDSPPRQPAYSLPTGAHLIPDRGARGRGELQAINGSIGDAVVTVTVPGTHRPLRSVYVRRGETISINNLAPGNYDVLFQTGDDWDRSNRRFNRNVSYFEFGKLLSYEEERDEEGVRYQVHKITLFVVKDGNVESRPLSEEEFKALGGSAD